MSVARFALGVSLLVGVVAAVAGLVVHRVTDGADRRLGLRSVAAGGAAGVLVALGALSAAQPSMGMGLFGVIHVAYLCVVIGLPLAASAGLVHEAVVRRSRPSAPVIAASVLALLAAPLGWYMTHVEPYRLEVGTVGTVALPAARAGAAPVTVAVLSDFQSDRIGDYQRAAIDRLLALHADVILIPGDVLQAPPGRFAAEVPAFREQLRRLHAPGGVFVVDGDVDSPDGLRMLIDGSEIRLLENEVVETNVRDRRITLLGLELDWTTPAATAAVDQLERRAGEDDIRVLLAHRPDAIDDVRPGSRIDLVVAGHTHGGQISLPGIGPLVTASGVPRSVAAGGLHELDGRRVLVSRGVGLERGEAPQVRFLTPPQLPVVTFTG